MAENVSNLGSWIVERPSRYAVYLDRRSVNARRILEDLSTVALVDHPAQADLLWIRKGFLPLLPHLKRHQVLNHFVDESAMINKGRLTELLRSCDGDTEFYPESYRLFDPDERQAFLKQLPRDDDPDNLWIFKPGGLSRGKGIRILWSFDRLKKQLGNGLNGDPPELDESLAYVAQRYIKNPLLLDGRKSEVRVYWLIASLDPLLVLMYREGTVRLNNADYKLADFDNQLIHVTNTYQQKSHPDFDPANELKWTFDALDAYLERERSEAKFTESRLKPAIRSALATVARAAAPKLGEQSTDALCFGLFGADLIIDDALRPRLTEVQKNPGLSYVGDSVKADVIPPMLREAVRIVLELRDRKMAGASVSNLASVNDFEWVVNDAD